ncbi:potassium channel family protein [Conexibacter woesei]|uniref:potassium channel family protein n=1 Tax=Conexibacter woesei TaxID=191495 RepID=UPI000688C2EF|nr:NAD(P)-binding protein [Conexibacter woesei]
MAHVDVLVVGVGDLAKEVEREVRARGARVARLPAPTDRELTAGVQAGPGAVVVISHDDIVALRYALVAEHARPGVALLVTVFDATVAAQIFKVVPNCHVVSLADVAAPVLAADCLGAARRHPPGPARRALAGLGSALLPFGASARLLVYGVLGLLVLLVIEAAVAVLALGEPPVRALYEATKAVATVGPDRAADDGPAWFQALSTAFMLMGMGLVAAATAGLVNRLLGRRLTAIAGRRSLPRRDHVIVVGLGQVGLRLCLILRQRGVRAVAIEQARDAGNIHLAKRLGIPVVVGDGTERGLLMRLGVRRAIALASVTSNDHVNIAVSVAALAAQDDLRVVLRSGDDDAVTETRALFPIGVVRDVNRLAARRFADLALGVGERRPS